MNKLNYEELKKKYEERINEQQAETDNLMRLWETFKEFFPKYKTLGNVTKNANARLNLDEYDGMRIVKDVWGKWTKMYYRKANKEVGTIYAYASCYEPKELSPLEQWEKGFYREMGHDSIAKLKEELKHLKENIEHYNKAVEELAKMKSPIPTLSETAKKHNIRDPEIHLKGFTYFARELFNPLEVR